MAILSILGILLFIVGWVWLMVVAYKAAGALWPVLIFFFSLLAGLIFCIMKKEGWMQWGIMVVGWLLIIFGGGMAAMTGGR
ncbi:MAG: hypothetical protein ABIP78_02255 [Pyrinomonadaceae bacterium]